MTGLRQCALEDKQVGMFAVQIQEIRIKTNQFHQRFSFLSAASPGRRDKNFSRSEKQVMT